MTSPDDYDNPWKEALEQYFEQCMALFFPQAAAEIDWSKGYEFLDKELQQIAPEAMTGQRTVDKLVKVWKRASGEEAWILIHIEVQSQVDSNFPERMYIYNYRIFDRYQRRVASFAILGDDSPTWRPDRYRYELWGCRVTLEFPTVKLLDYQTHWAELEQSANPFAVVVMAHLHTQATRHQPQERYNLKWRLTRGLYERGYSKKDVRLLFRFIDWLMALPPDLHIVFNEQLLVYEGDKKMPYISGVERMVIEREVKREVEQSVLQQSRDHIIEIIKVRFTDAPQKLVDSLEAITNPNILDRLHRQAITIESVESFQKVVDEALANAADNDQV